MDDDTAEDGELDKAGMDLLVAAMLEGMNVLVARGLIDAATADERARNLAMGAMGVFKMTPR
jgi:hypothetical protein